MDASGDELCDVVEAVHRAFGVWTELALTDTVAGLGIKANAALGSVGATEQR